MGCCQSKGETLPSSSGKLLKEKKVTKGDFVGISRENIRDKYEIVKTLGSGGFGVVYLVKDKHTAALYAMKELQKNRMSDEECMKLLQEVDILRQLVR